MTSPDAERAIGAIAHTELSQHQKSVTATVCMLVLLQYSSVLFDHWSLRSLLECNALGPTVRWKRYVDQKATSAHACLYEAEAKLNC
jgi:hypothetical protein